MTTAPLLIGSAETRSRRRVLVRPSEWSVGPYRVVDGGVFDKLTQGMGVGAAVDGASQSAAVQQLVGLLGGVLANKFASADKA